MTDVETCLSCPRPDGCVEESAVASYLHDQCPLYQAVQARKRKRDGGTFKTLPEGWLTVSDASRLLHRRTQTICKWIKKGKIKAELVQREGWVREFWAIPESELAKVQAR